MIVRANRTVAVERIIVVGRREFLAIGGQTSLLALASRAAGPFAPNRDSAGDDQIKSPRDARQSSGLFSSQRASLFQSIGPRYVALVCDYELFHNEADRWPAAVDVGVLAKYARAFATGTAQIAAT